MPCRRRAGRKSNEINETASRERCKPSTVTTDRPVDRMQPKQDITPARRVQLQASREGTAEL
jgi:hypothetical protein